MTAPTIIGMFVGGPDHGVRRELPDHARDWRVIEQPAVKALSAIRAADVDMRVSDLRTHLCVRVKEMEYRRMRGYWIFEWMGES
jgi:hypothetical protein